MEESRAPEGSDFARKRGEKETEQDFCELVCREELQLTPCDW